MARLPLIALAALVLAAPAGGAAQFRAEPLVVRLPWAETDVLAGQLGAGEGDSLVVVQQGIAAAERRPWRDLLRRDPSAFPVGWTSSRRFRAGYLRQAGADALVDVATPVSTGVAVVFGSDPGTLQQYATSTATGPDSVASFLRLLPRAAPAAGRAPSVLVVPISLADPLSRVMVVDVDETAVPATADSRWWPTPTMTVPTLVGWHEAFPVRLSPVARSAGVDDVAIGVFGGVVLLTHASAPGTTLASLSFASPVHVGGGYTLGQRPPWLPPTVSQLGDALGVTSLDVNQDGLADLVFTNATAFGVPPLPRGALLWAEGTGNPADFADPALTPWHDLGADPALDLDDPLIVRGVDLGGTGSLAVWDRGRQEIVVATPDAGAGGFRVWRAPAPGERAVDVFLADVVGSTAPDLVVVMANPTALDEVLVYPDLGDAAPALAWAPGSPGAPARGMDHVLAVDASDADGPAPRVEWLVGDDGGPPAGEGNAYTVSGASLCAVPPPDVEVTVRATDDRGVFTELVATLPVGIFTPTLALAGGRLRLAPGGASAVLLGRVALACGAQAVWGGSWQAGATFVDESQPDGNVRRTVTLPETTYPGLLAGTTSVSLTSDDVIPTPVTSMPIDLDAEGLVDVRHTADGPLLAEGDLAILRTEVRSRLSVPLPQVRVTDVLAGLVAAGEPRVSGAAVSGGSGGEVVLDPLPAAPAVVRIELPVASRGGGGASAVEVRSSGGWLLTPAASVGPGAEAPLGCSCGASSPGSGGLALLALLALGRPGRRLRGRGRRAPAP